MFSMLVINREFEQCFCLIQNKTINQIEIKVQGRLANKINNRTVSYKHRTGRILV